MSTKETIFIGTTLALSYLDLSNGTTLALSYLDLSNSCKFVIIVKVLKGKVTSLALTVYMFWCYCFYLYNCTKTYLYSIYMWIEGTMYMLQIVMMLLEYGAKPDSPDSDGR